MSEPTHFERAIEAIFKETWPVWAVLIAVLVAWRQIAGEAPSTMFQIALGIIPIGMAVAVAVRAVRSAP